MVPSYNCSSVTMLTIRRKYSGKILLLLLVLPLQPLLVPHTTFVVCGGTLLYLFYYHVHILTDATITFTIALNAPVHSKCYHCYRYLYFFNHSTATTTGDVGMLVLRPLLLVLLLLLLPLRLLLLVLPLLLLVLLLLLLPPPTPSPLLLLVKLLLLLLLLHANVNAHSLLNETPTLKSPSND